MVEDRITDGVRIAELLSAELRGLETGPLGSTAVSDARSDIRPTTEGDEVYRIMYEDQSIASVTAYPDYVDIALLGNREWVDSPLPSSIPEQSGITQEDGVLRIEFGAAVKRAVDVLIATLDADGDI